MKLIKFLNNGAEYQDPDVLHSDAAIGSDYTLCGVSLDHDEDTIGHHKIVERKKITCPDCVALIKFCQKIKL